MTVTDKKLAANRANAKKSTGPRTAAGKRRCSKNAVTHGVFCNDTVLPGEDPELFESFRHAVLLKLSPQDIVELMIVDRIVIAQWKLRRLNTVEAQAHRARIADRQDTACQALAKQRLERDAERFQSDADADADADADDADYDHQDLCNDVHEQVLDAEEINLNATDSIAIGLINDDGLIERLSRYEQRLELAIYRGLRELAKLRKQTQRNDADDSRNPTLKRCPFLPGKEYQIARRFMRGEDARGREDRNQENRAKEPTTKDTKGTRNEGPRTKNEGPRTKHHPSYEVERIVEPTCDHTASRIIARDDDTAGADPNDRAVASGVVPRTDTA